MRRITGIIPPWVFTDDGKRYHVKDFEKTPQKGLIIDDDLKVVGSSNDSDCVSGVCPVK